MRSKDHLIQTLHRIDGRGYKAYKDIEGEYNFNQFQLFIDHVQGDPFASPSRLRVRMPQKIAEFPLHTFRSKNRSIALRDYITRMFSKAAKRFSFNRGTGKSGEILIDHPGQEILERTSAFVNEDYIEVRFFLGLPAFGRKIAGRFASTMLLENLPEIIEASLPFKNQDRTSLFKHIETAEDADYLRGKLQEMNLLAFVADGAILPRASGINFKPLSHGTVIPFESPESFRVKVKLPNRGIITGMGIPQGVTLIVGGGYHGKSTLLKALEAGIYNHIPGDGRELVLTDPHAIKIRAEDGRRIEKVDISPFISRLPFERNTQEFTTDDASGSTSQAANTIEALEAGATVLLIDEDTSATNFMIRDHRMQELVSKDREPITPFIDKIRQLFQEHKVSTLLVIGGSGDYFDVADQVICMMEYKPIDLTEQAQKIALKYKAERTPEGGKTFGRITPRIPQPSSFNPQRGKKAVKIAAKGLKSIQFGIHSIDLSAVEQLVDNSQANAIGDAIYYALKYMNTHQPLKKVIDKVLSDISLKGLDVLNPRLRGDYAAFREIELAAAINRLRTLEVIQQII